MKRFIAFLICMITMMVVMPPGKVKASPDQPPGYCIEMNVDQQMSVSIELSLSDSQFYEYSNPVQLQTMLPGYNYAADLQPVFDLPEIYTCKLDRLRQLNYAANQRPPNAPKKSFPRNMMVEYGLIRTTRESTLV